MLRQPKRSIPRYESRWKLILKEVCAWRDALERILHWCAILALVGWSVVQAIHTGEMEEWYASYVNGLQAKLAAIESHQGGAVR